ncbi:hypothetical protein [Opitutus terrae]|uniref:Lipoprotein SmpA/OmlA domain-containing protein n=1 Tax=Opitutus terrae (strain DSM 11246 / JCM 15787 / PB90-1) TaxID=452637 RepID=B1ZN68_OPITP|nr:hypothetical protein [Opitutus terrae]ACB73437.1 hypothetical protein Oter_0146 [Opitutus terrae PB90-1]
MSTLQTHLRSLVLAVGLVAATATCAAEPGAQGWSALARSISREQARAILGPLEGAPLIITHSRDGRFEVWNYDRGAYLLFVGGALDYWSTPRSGPAFTPDRSE